MNEDNPVVCVIDDESSIRVSLRNLLRSAGLKVQTFTSAQEFLSSPPVEALGCLVLDVHLPGISGLDLQRELGSGDGRIPIIFITGHGDIPMSVRAMKAGAIEFLTKPFRDEELLSAIDQAINWGRQFKQSRVLPIQKHHDTEEEPGSEISFPGIVGQSPALCRVLLQAETVAPNDATVLILGETGTGKELIVRAVHQRSRRRDGPLVRVNCSSIPKELFESEFFGHAAGGTLFLDEVGEIPLELQSKLLRVLQEKSYERVGEEKTRYADVRIVAATNRDLKKEVTAGRFREDLYYRLYVFPLKVAPLRERKEDIPLLASHFVELSVKELGCPKPRLTPAGIETLLAYDWPGNIRELRNVILRAVIFARGGALEFDLPVTGVAVASHDRQDSDQSEPEFLTESEMRGRERENLFAVLQKAGWKIKGINGAAELLGVRPTTLVARIEKMGLKRPALESAPTVK